MKIEPMVIRLRLSSETPKRMVAQAIYRDLSNAIFARENVTIEAEDCDDDTEYSLELFVFTADELDELLTQHELCVRRGERVEL